MLAEIIPFLCISTVWSRDLVLSYPGSPQGSPWGPTAAADGLMATASFAGTAGNILHPQLLEILWELPHCDTETGSEQRLLKNGTDILLLGVTNLQSVNAISMKHNKAKHNKMMCICILSWHKILFFFILNYSQPLPWTLFSELMTNSREICWHYMGLCSALYLSWMAGSHILSILIGWCTYKYPFWLGGSHALCILICWCT